MLLSSSALETLQEVFGADFDYQRHNVWTAVKMPIHVANVQGGDPDVSVTLFKAEVTCVQMSRNAGRELSGALLTAAGMNAIGAFLEDWEKEQQGHAK